MHFTSPSEECIAALALATLFIVLALAMLAEARAGRRYNSRYADAILERHRRRIRLARQAPYVDLDVVEFAHEPSYQPHDDTGGDSTGSESGETAQAETQEQ